MTGSRPTFAEHLGLMEHDSRHGAKAARLGDRGKWLRMWWIKRNRQWTKTDAIVCGSNAVLGALACARLAEAGHSVSWILESGTDAWDYPLTVAGQHDDLMREHGLGPMGPDLFKQLAGRCKKITFFITDWSVDYSFESSAGIRICFASRIHIKAENAWGEARRMAEGWARDAFESEARHVVLNQPKRSGGGARQQLFAAPLVVWTSDRPDGLPRQHRGASDNLMIKNPAEIRLGRSLWHAQEPTEFAARSREDVRIALSLRFPGAGV